MVSYYSGEIICTLPVVTANFANRTGQRHTTSKEK